MTTDATTQLSAELTARENEILLDKGMKALGVLKQAGVRFAITDKKDFAQCVRGMILVALGIEPRMVEYLADAGLTVTIKIGRAQGETKAPVPKRRTRRAPISRSALPPRVIK